MYKLKYISNGQVEMYFFVWTRHTFSFSHLSILSGFCNALCVHGFGSCKANNITYFSKLLLSGICIFEDMLG